jgi:hypothetical protein
MHRCVCMTSHKKSVGGDASRSFIVFNHKDTHNESLVEQVLFKTGSQ